MEPEEVFRQPPVYKWEQCITEQDLRDAIQILLVELEHVPVFYVGERDALIVAIKTLDTMLDWIQQGKPKDFHMKDL